MAKELTLEEIDKQIADLKKTYEESLKALKEHKATLEDKKREEMEKAREARKAEVDEALNKYLDLRDKYVSDYGYYMQNVNRKSKTSNSSKKLDFIDYFWN